jgi:transcriptional regulator with PAS, ATPase and Fis domain
MSLKTQAKLLRVLQEKEFERLGSTKTRKVDVRFIAATNQDLKRNIEEGTFREDLYFRLSVILLELPSLHERVADILPIARYYLDFFNKKYSKHIMEFSDQVKQILILHNWPGNVRELRNCIERAVIFTERERIEVEDLPMQYHPKAPVETSYLGSFYESVDREMVLNALEKAGGSRTRAAEILNISRKTLYLKMKKLGIET